jgi:two-component system, OmpR family, sensor histidine kinase ChvG
MQYTQNHNNAQDENLDTLAHTADIETAGSINLHEEIRKKRKRGGIAGIIFIGSFAGLLVLVIGSLVFNELRSGLTQARADTLRAQGMTIASVIAEAAVVGEPAPMLDESAARVVLKRLFREPGARIRLYSKERLLIADSAVIYDEIAVRELPPLKPQIPDLKRATEQAVENARFMVQGALGDPQAALSQEVNQALSGEITAHERYDENGNRVVSVSLPIQRVRAVVGVITLESTDVSQIVSRERRALVPFIIAAVLANLLMASLLAWLIARPLQRLADAADKVTQGKSNHLHADKLIKRPDEIGELAESLHSMMQSLQERIGANERFAADVAHEIKNPLAAIKNAAELLQTNLSAEQRTKLEAIMFGGLKRVDKLVTDISNASRMDAEYSRHSRKPLAIKSFLNHVHQIYQPIAEEKNIKLLLNFKDIGDNDFISAREEAINRVLVNLLDNAISFAPPSTKIFINARLSPNRLRIKIDDEGQGIPPEAIEKIFSRFYTQRPKSHGNFGSHSGLGLAIARQIVESHEGKIYAKNRKIGEKIIGASFIIELPI